jgi:hypothetical protein
MTENLAADVVGCPPLMGHVESRMLPHWANGPHECHDAATTASKFASAGMLDAWVASKPG